MCVCAHMYVYVYIDIYSQYVLAARMNEWKCACICMCILKLSKENSLLNSEINIAFEGQLMVITKLEKN